MNKKQSQRNWLCMKGWDYGVLHPGNNLKDANIQIFEPLLGFWRKFILISLNHRRLSDSANIKTLKQPKKTLDEKFCTYLQHLLICSSDILG